MQRHLLAIKNVYKQLKLIQNQNYTDNSKTNQSEQNLTTFITQNPLVRMELTPTILICVNYCCS